MTTFVLPRRRTRSSHFLSGLGPEKVPLGSNGLANGYIPANGNLQAPNGGGGYGGQASSGDSVRAALAERFAGGGRAASGSFHGESGAFVLAVYVCVCVCASGVVV